MAACASCGKTLENVRSGIYVIKWHGGRPVQVWLADLLRCPICGLEICGGFGSEPIGSLRDVSALNELVQRIADDAYEWRT